MLKSLVVLSRVFALLSIIALCLLGHRMVKSKSAHIASKWYIGIILCCTVILWLLCDTLLNYFIALSLCFSLIMYAYFGFYVKSQWKSLFLLSSILLHSICFITIIIATTLLVRNVLQKEALQCLQMIMMSLFIYGVYRVYDEDKIHNVSNYYKKLFLIFIVEVLLNVIIGLYFFQKLEEHSTFGIYHLVLSILQIISFYLCLHQYTYLQRTNDMEQQLLFVEKQWHHQLQHYQHIEEQIKDIRVMKHDYLASMNIVTTLLEAKKYEEMKSYVQNIKDSIKDPTNYYNQFSNSMEVDALLLAAYKQAKELSIDFKAKILLGKLPFDNSTICYMLSLLIEYAMESNGNQSKEKFIHLDSQVDQNWQKIRLQCSCSNKEIIESKKWNNIFEEIKGILQEQGFAEFEFKEENIIVEGYICISIRHEGEE